MTSEPGRVCPFCEHNNNEKAVLCASCGRYMGLRPAKPSGADTRRIPIPEVKGASQPSGTVQSMDTDRLPGSIYFEAIGSPLALRVDYVIGQFSIGREDPVAKLSPDVDLTMFEARKHGISRLHAMLRCTTSKVFLQDLNSANGTRYNGKTLIPATSKQIANRGLVQFGSLALRVIIIPPYGNPADADDEETTPGQE